MFSVTDLAAKVGGVAEGDTAQQITAAASLLEAQADDITFLANPKYAPQAATTKASCVIVGKDFDGASSAASLIRVENPDKAFAEVVPLFAPPPIVRTPGIHATALIGANVTLGARVHVGAYTIIEDGAAIDDDTVIEAQCFIGVGVTIGKNSHLYPQVVVREYCRLGERNILHAGVKIGTDGFGYTIEFANGMPVVNKIPQVGIVVLGNDVEVGSNTCIDRARFGRTQVGSCVKIDNLVQIGHNVQIGDFSGVIAQAGIAGSTRVGSGVMIWSQAGISGHLHIGDRSQVGPQAGLTKDVPEGDYVIGSPALSKREYAENVLMLPKQLARLKKKVAELEAKLKEDSK